MPTLPRRAARSATPVVPRVRPADARAHAAPPGADDLDATVDLGEEAGAETVDYGELPSLGGLDMPSQPPPEDPHATISPPSSSGAQLSDPLATIAPSDSFPLPTSDPHATIAPPSTGGGGPTPSDPDQRRRAESDPSGEGKGGRPALAPTLALPGEPTPIGQLPALRPRTGPLRDDAPYRQARSSGAAAWARSASSTTSTSSARS